MVLLASEVNKGLVLNFHISLRGSLDPLSPTLSLTVFSVYIRDHLCSFHTDLMQL